jgi:hypothetical protein
VISISSSVGISFCSYDLVTWSKQIGMQSSVGLMKSPENRSTLSFDSIASSTFGSRSDPWPCYSHVVSFSPVYSQAGRARYWRGAMHFDSKSNNTIINIKSFSARNWILLTTGVQVRYKSGTFSQPERLPIGVAVGNSSQSWTSANTITQSSL